MMIFFKIRIKVCLILLSKFILLNRLYLLQLRFYIQYRIFGLHESIDLTDIHIIQLFQALFRFAWRYSMKLLVGVHDEWIIGFTEIDVFTKLTALYLIIILI
jgi:hypothetical protein